MAKAVDDNKWLALVDLKQGDKVKLTDGSTAAFVRLKQSKFIGMIGEKSYDIPVNMFVEVIEKAPQADLNAHKKLKEGEAFYINREGKAILFIFECIENGRIIGRNPIDKSRARIDVVLYAGKVKDISLGE